MSDITIILKEYDIEEKIITCDIYEGKKMYANVQKKGMNVDEFKKFIRSKYSDANIVNKVSKHKAKGHDADTTVAVETSEEKEIKQLMKNNWED